MTARPALLLSVVLLAVPPAVRAQAPAASPPESQLDRIEHKLDEVLRRLDHPPPSQLRASAQSGSGEASGRRNVPAPSPTSVPAPEAYKAGAIAVLRAAPRDHNQLENIPPDSVGGFVYTGGPMSFTDVRERGIRYFAPVGVELEGWLRVTEAGRYELATDLTAHFTTTANSPPTCLLHAWLEGSSLGERTAFVTKPGSNEADATLVLGAELQPGLYRLRLWTVCDDPPGVGVTSELLLKTPSELNLRPVTGADLLHKEG